MTTIRLTWGYLRQDQFVSSTVFPQEDFDLGPGSVLLTRAPSSGPLSGLTARLKAVSGAAYVAAVETIEEGLGTRIEGNDVAYISIQRNDPLSAIEVQTEQVPGEGATLLGHLTDVDMSTPPEDGESLVYDGTAGVWRPLAVSTGGGGGGTVDPDEIRTIVSNFLIAGENVSITQDGSNLYISATGGGAPAEPTPFDPEAVRDAVAAALVAGTNVTITVDDASDTILISAEPTPFDAEAVRDAVAAALVAGEGVSLTVDDNANTITITATTPGGLDAEGVRDAIGAALVAGTGISLTVNDAGDTITVSATASGLDAEGVRDTIAAALVAGTGISLTVNDAGDTITVSAVGAPRARDFWHRSYTFGDQQNAVAGQVMPDGLRYTFGASGAGVGGITPYDDFSIGQRLLSTGTNAAGYVHAQEPAPIKRNGTASLELYFRTALHVLSNATDRFYAYMGMFPSDSPPGSSTTVVAGVGFRYLDNVNGGKWQALVGDGAVVNFADTGVVANTVMTRFKITWAGGLTNFLFFINETQVASIPSTNMFTNAMAASMGVGKVLGTAQAFMSADDMEVLIGRKYA